MWFPNNAFVAIASPGRLAQPQGRRWRKFTQQDSYAPVAFGDQNEADAVDFVMEPELNIFANTGSRLGFGGVDHTQPSPTPTPRELHFGEQIGRIQTTKGSCESGSPTTPSWLSRTRAGSLSHKADVRQERVMKTILNNIGNAIDIMAGAAGGLAFSILTCLTLSTALRIADIHVSGLWAIILGLLLIGPIIGLRRRDYFAQFMGPIFNATALDVARTTWGQTM